MSNHEDDQRPLLIDYDTAPLGRAVCYQEWKKKDDVIDNKKSNINGVNVVSVR